MKKFMVVILVLVLTIPVFAKGQTESDEQQLTKELSFPTGPITLVCPWAAGAGADLICRMFESLGMEYFGVPIVVENQVGAAGMTATLNFLNAKNDGYSVLFNNGGVFTSKLLTGAAGYSIQDFQPLCGIVKDINILICNSKNLGVSNFEEFLEKFSGTEKTLLMGAGTAGIPHICMAQLFDKANIKFKQIAYSGGSEISAALLGGHVDIVALGASEINIVKDAKNIALLTAFADETPEALGLENVPPLANYGYDIDTSVWRMLLVPKGTPEHIFNKLYEGFTGMIQDVRFKDFAKKNGITIDMKSPEEVTKAVEDELSEMIPIFKALKLGIYSN
ncbi:MAG: Bug family tripartite tricarboxylate transporter substrate binding protein [Peptococcales bacterium]|jgi:tripartite-type tricarboxylate transporter receptor subunit TctC